MKSNRNRSVQQPLYRQPVGIESEAAYHSLAGCGNEGMVAEVFSLMDIGDMHLYNGTFYGAYAVVQGNAGVGVGSGVQHNAVEREAHLLYLVYQFSLNIALIVFYLYLRILLTQLGQIALERLAAVYPRLSHAEQVEIGTIHYLYLHIPGLVCFLQPFYYLCLVFLSCPGLTAYGGGVQTLGWLTFAKVQNNNHSDNN